MATSAPTGTATALLHAAQAGDPDAWQRLVGLIEEELRIIALARLSREPKGPTWQVDDLVQHVFAKLFEDGVLDRAPNGAYVYGAAARVIRNLMTDRGRRRGVKGRHRASLSSRIDEARARLEEQQKFDIEALNSALTELEQLDAFQYEIVMLMFFADRTLQQVADLLGKSRSLVEKAWLNKAKPWLFRRLRDTP